MASKLTKAQAKVIKLLQVGECITCSQTHYYVSDKYTSHRISWRVWQALTGHDGRGCVNKGEALIYQTPFYPFDFVLTKKGEEIKL